MGFSFRVSEPRAMSDTRSLRMQGRCTDNSESRRKSARESSIAVYIELSSGAMKQLESAEGAGFPMTRDTKENMYTYMGFTPTKEKRATMQAYM